jgi:sec-independent protein translocase protein TatA
MPFNIGPFELLLVLVLALLILGPGKLPEVGAALGRTLRDFRKATTEVDEAVKAADVTKPLPAKPVETQTQAGAQPADVDNAEPGAAGR